MKVKKGNLITIFLTPPQPAATEADIPSTLTKQGSEHPDALALHNEVAKCAECVLCLRGGMWLPKF